MQYLEKKKVGQQLKKTFPRVKVHTKHKASSALTDAFEFFSVSFVLFIVNKN